MATLGFDRAPAFLSDLINTLTERGRSLLGLSNGSRAMSKAGLITLGETLLSPTWRGHWGGARQHAAGGLCRSK